ncbi:MAG TPA: hypothetical protein VEF04_04810 [Blastocatellia bacterium]|nr:hypothetical protein [Blastocatellia bacterium]
MLETLLDRPIAYHRALVKVTGSVTAAVMLSQSLYWQKRSSSGDGFFWKTQEEWEEETGLTRYEQEGARKRLKECGVWLEERRGIPSKLYFKVDTSKLRTLLIQVANKDAEKPHTGMRKSNIQEAGKPANSDAEKPQANTENTRDYAETTPGGAGEIKPQGDERIGYALEALFPGHKHDVRIMRALVSCILEAGGGGGDVEAFPAWFREKHPKAQLNYHKLKDHFHEMMQERKGRIGPVGLVPSKPRTVFDKNCPKCKGVGYYAIHDGKDIGRTVPVCECAKVLEVQAA